MQLKQRFEALNWILVQHQLDGYEINSIDRHENDDKFEEAPNLVLSTAEGLLDLHPSSSMSTIETLNSIFRPQNFDATCLMNMCPVLQTTIRLQTGCDGNGFLSSSVNL